MPGGAPVLPGAAARTAHGASAAPLAPWPWCSTAAAAPLAHPAAGAKPAIMQKSRNAMVVADSPFHLCLAQRGRCLVPAAQAHLLLLPRAPAPFRDIQEDRLKLCPLCFEALETTPTLPHCNPSVGVRRKTVQLTPSRQRFVDVVHHRRAELLTWHPPPLDLHEDTKSQAAFFCRCRGLVPNRGQCFQHPRLESIKRRCFDVLLQRCEQDQMLQCCCKLATVSRANAQSVHGDIGIIPSSRRVARPLAHATNTTQASSDACAPACLRLLPCLGCML
mmetsp:Transcript_142756/g.455755  ORF Transcript_142756/g.455755 Transcript_142756/m.455755 type:complete len:276 (+) Transcript_142756:387-1214(+)